MLEIILYVVGFVVLSLLFAGLQRKFFPHTSANGFMDKEKGEEVCPEVFEDSDDSNRCK